MWCVGVVHETHTEVLTLPHEEEAEATKDLVFCQKHKPANSLEYITALHEKG